MVGGRGLSFLSLGRGIEVRSFEMRLKWELGKRRMEARSERAGFF